MTNAERILSGLDTRLTAPVELTLYGRAALQLGFERALPEHAMSRDEQFALAAAKLLDALRLKQDGTRHG